MCHQGGRTEVLGFSAVQLSPQRDPGALHADPSPSSGADVGALIERGLLVGLPASLEAPPAISAASAIERTALGYLHGNCGHCHNEQGPLRNVGLFLRQAAGGSAERAIASTVNHPVRKPAPGQSDDATLRIEPRHPDRSALMQRMASRAPALQMPPLGTELLDRQAVDLLRRWIAGSERNSADINPPGKRTMTMKRLLPWLLAAAVFAPAAIRAQDALRRARR